MPSPGFDQRDGENIKRIICAPGSLVAKTCSSGGAQCRDTVEESYVPHKVRLRSFLWPWSPKPTKTELTGDDA